MLYACTTSTNFLSPPPSPFPSAHMLVHSCLVYDFGSRNRLHGVPRALWYGLEFCKYVLNDVWLDRRVEVCLRGHNVGAQFKQHLDGFHRSTIR